VDRGVPAFLAGAEPVSMPSDTSGRLELARWIASEKNPLTARVMVNRVWQHHFGRGIVPAPSNFGLSGEPPTHPELLDWLARRFVNRGWSIKALHRDILLSQTYQMAGQHDATNTAMDPENRLYWNFSRQRLDAEAIRDAMLAISGLLDLNRPGAHPFPGIDEWNWSQHNPFKANYPSVHRSVYLMTQRLQRHPYLALFDGPDTNTTTASRSQSTVPLQALYLMNSPFVKEQAAALARKLFSASPERRERIRLAHRMVYGRDPVVDEYDRGLVYVDRYAADLAALQVPREEAELESWLSYSRTLLVANEFLYMD
jgi:hypothetical protein